MPFRFPVSATQEVREVVVVDVGRAVNMNNARTQTWDNLPQTGI